PRSRSNRSSRPSRPRRTRRRSEGEVMRRLVLSAAVFALLTSVGIGAGMPVAGAKSEKGVVVFNGQGNDLDAYTATPPFKHQTVIQTRAKDPKGLDLNAQICFFPDNKTFIGGEDTGQPDPVQGWGIFRLSGTKVGRFK